MLQLPNTQFLAYCRMADFSKRSIQALTIRLNEFRSFLWITKIESVDKIAFKQLFDFTTEFKNPSIHVTKSRIWMLRQFYHFLTLHRIVPDNIATGLPYPKIEKTVPQFLTSDELNRLIRYFSDRADSSMGIRNLIIIMLLSMLGLRTGTLVALNVEDIDLVSGLLWTREKGRRRRSVVLPHSICKIIRKYLQLRKSNNGPLLLSKRKKRISPRTLQDIFRQAADRLHIDKKLHARLFRHTAATHLNQVAGIDITQDVLGHSQRANTLKYAHLNPDRYAFYMKKHPFMKKEAA